MMLHKHLFKKYFIFSILFSIGVVGSFLSLYLIESTFRLKTVEVIGVSSVERKKIQRLFIGKSTLTLQKGTIQSLIKSLVPTGEMKESQIRYPSTLTIIIELEKPIAFLQSDFGFISLSQRGTVLAKERTTEVRNPSINFYQIIHHSEYQIGQKIAYSAIERALLFITLLSEIGYQTETVAIDSVDMIACKTKGFVVVFSQTRPIDLQVHEVRQIVRQVRAGALRIDRLDLRFDKPVVQLPKK